MQTIQPAFAFVFGHLAPKPLTLSAETETPGIPLYRNRKQTETAFSVGFGAETETELAVDYYSMTLSSAVLPQKTKSLNNNQQLIRFCQPSFIILAHIHYRKLATGGYLVSPSHTICVMANKSSSRLYACLYMFTTINS